MTKSRSDEDRIAALPEHLRELLRRQLAGAAEPVEDTITPARPGDGEHAPQSLAQRRMWLSYELDPSSAEHNSLWLVRLTGALDVAALERSLRALVARHESLRTTFDVVVGQGVQIVRPAAGVPVPVTDLSTRTGPDRDAALARELHHAAVRPFDLRTGPLFLARLVRLAAHEHVLALSMHHIVVDGWSMGVLVDELGRLYTAARRG